MISIKNNSNNPHFNLALEEYALKHLADDEEIIILWQNEPSVIIGRNQNTIEEINSKYIEENNIHVVRRLSGGGAVYHDWGNLNFTFIAKNEKDNLNNFKKFTKPVIKTLKKLGIESEFSGRNDITIDGKKFSGNAQYYYNNKLIHHGTILFNSDLGVVQNALNVKSDKIQSKGIKSVKNRVTNIYPYLKEHLTIMDFKDILLDSILRDTHSLGREYTLTKEDTVKIRKIMQERYMTWKWNYGKSPKFNFHNSKRYVGGNLDIRLDVNKGVIKNIKIFGDFFGKKNIKELENNLKNLEYKKEIIKNKIDNLHFNDYIFSITKDEFLNCMFY